MTIVNKKIKIILVFLSVLAGSFNPLMNVRAIDLIGDNLSDAPGVDFTIDKLFQVLLGAACWLSRAAILIIVSALVVYGFLYFKSQGNPSVMTEAKSALKWGLVGIIVIFGVYTIIKTVAYTVGADLGTSWLPLNCP